MAKYQKTVLDDGRYQLTGAVQNGAKFPPAFMFGVKTEEYKGYTNTFICLKVRTNIEGDKNHGWINADVDVPQGYHILNCLRSMTRESQKMSWEVRNYVFGRDKKRSEEPHVVATVTIGVKDDSIYIAVTDGRDSTRPKIAFRFGHNPRPRYPATFATGEDKFLLSQGAAIAYADAILAVLPRLIENSIAVKVGVADTGGADEDTGSSNGNAGGLDDDIPF